MQKVKIFLASSIVEFKNERNLIGDVVRKLQDEWIEKEIRIKLFECEFFENNLVLGGLQKKYNDELKDTDIFIMLVGKKIGKYTKEEFLEARDNFQVKNILIFKSNILDRDDDTKRFLEEEKHYVLTFNNNLELENIIKNKILKEINSMLSL